MVPHQWLLCHLEAVCEPFVKESNRSIHSAQREDFLCSLDGMQRYPFSMMGEVNLRGMWLRQ